MKVVSGLSTTIKSMAFLDMDGDEPSLPPPSPGVLPKSPPRAPLHGGVVAGVPRMTQQTR